MTQSATRHVFGFWGRPPKGRSDDSHAFRCLQHRDNPKSRHSLVLADPKASLVEGKERDEKEGERTEEFREINLTIPVRVDLVDHVLQLGLGRVLT